MLGGRGTADAGAGSLLEAACEPAQQLPPETLDVFLAESGLPLRVVRSTGAGPEATSSSTDILSINIPVHVNRPAARRTIGQARFDRLSEQSIGSSGDPSGGFTIETG